MLLVDDHAEFRISVSAWLAQEGFDVVGTAPTGRQGALLTAELEPDLVLLDLHLPDRSGVEVAGDLAALDPRPAVILISSDIAAAEDPLVRAAPVLGFLAKRDLACAAINDLLS